MEGADTTREGRELGSATEAMSLLKRKHCGCNIRLIFYFPFFFWNLTGWHQPRFHGDFKVS